MFRFSDSSQQMKFCRHRRDLSTVKDYVRHCSNAIYADIVYLFLFSFLDVNMNCFLIADFQTFLPLVHVHVEAANVPLVLVRNPGKTGMNAQYLEP